MKSSSPFLSACRSDLERNGQARNGDIRYANVWNLERVVQSSTDTRAEFRESAGN